MEHAYGKDILAFGSRTPLSISKIEPHLRALKKVAADQPKCKYYEYLLELCNNHTKLQQLDDITDNIHEFVAESEGKSTSFGKGSNIIGIFPGNCDQKSFEATSVQTDNDGKIKERMIQHELELEKAKLERQKAKLERKKAAEERKKALAKAAEERKAAARATKERQKAAEKERKESQRAVAAENARAAKRRAEAARERALREAEERKAEAAREKEEQMRLAKAARERARNAKKRIMRKNADTSVSNSFAELAQEAVKNTT